MDPSYRIILQEKEDLIKHLKEEIMKRDQIISMLQDKCIFLKNRGKNDKT